MSLFTMYCRIYQNVFKIASGFMPWSAPHLMEGPGSVKLIPDLLKEQQLNSVLVVTGGVISKLGLVQPLLDALKQNNILYTVYDKTVPNPTINNIEEALQLYTQNNCKALIAFGGGSPIDCAKGVGARVARPDKTISAMKGLLKVRRKLPILIAIPTTAGTGSETTLAAVISNPETHEKYPINDHVLIPRYAILDPELTTGLPLHITSTTGMDALTHAVEAYIGRSNTGETERDSIEAVRIIMESLVDVYEHPADIAGRGRLLKAAYLAGKAFTRAYVGNVHAMAHTLGGFYGVPHGLANSVILPYMLDYYGLAAEKRLAKLARLSGTVNARLDDTTAARQFIDKIRSMNKTMNIPEGIAGIKATDIPLMVQRALAEANPLYPVPRILNKRDVEVLFEQIAAPAGGLQ